MLTWDDIKGLCDCGAGILWLPRGYTEVPPEGRALVMLPNVYQEFCHGTWFAPAGEPSARTRERKASLRLVLERYVKGHHLNLNRDIKELGTKKINAAMRGCWEFRSHPPKEETRLFGFFARPGAFIAVSFQARGKFVTQNDWQVQRNLCHGYWNSLTGTVPYMTGPWPVLLSADLAEYTERK